MLGIELKEIDQKLVISHLLNNLDQNKYWKMLILIKIGHVGYQIKGNFIGRLTLSCLVSN